MVRNDGSTTLRTEGKRHVLDHLGRVIFHPSSPRPHFSPFPCRFQWKISKSIRKEAKRQPALPRRVSLFLRRPAAACFSLSRNKLPFRVYPIHGSKDSVLCMVNLMYTDACGVADCKYADHFIFQCCSLPSPCPYWHRLDCNIFLEVHTGGGRKTLCRTSGRPLTARSSSSAVLGGCCSTWSGIRESRTFSVVPDGSERWQHHTADRRKTPCP